MTFRQDFDIAQAIAKIEKIGGLAVDEIERRLQENPTEPNFATLVRLATESAKINLAFSRHNKEIAIPKVKHFIQVVNHTGLPVERQKELLVKGIEQIEGRGDDACELRAALDNLLGSNEAGKALAIDAGS